MRHAFSVLTIGLIGLVLPSGCKKESDGPGAAAPAAGERAATPAPAPASFEWTEDPTVEMIPAGPVKGQANNEPFQARAIFFEPGFKTWRMVIHEGELKSPTGIRPPGQHLNISLIDEPGPGKKIVKQMKYGDGYFQVKRPDDPTKTTSWNASNAYAIEITSWDVKPYDPQGPMFQHAGSASGRVAVTYKGHGKFSNSSVAGTFDKVPVRYMGKPYWLKDKDKDKGKAATPRKS